MAGESVRNYGAPMQDAKRRLLWHGALLILVALATGIAIPVFENPRMGLSAHVGGVMIGMLLVLYGLLWPELRLSERGQRFGILFALWGGWLNYLGLVLAAALGTSAMTPIAGAGHVGSAASELLVNVVFVMGAVDILAAAGIVVVGLASQRSAA